MAFANFDALCSGLCEAAGCAEPEITTSDDGARAFAVGLGGVEFTIGHVPTTDEDSVFVFAWIGEPPEDSGVGPLHVQLTCSMQLLSGADLYQTIVRLTETAGQWRQFS